MIDLDWITLVSGVLLPMLVALVTAQLASPGLKAVVLAVLSAVSGVLNELVAVNGDFAAIDWKLSAGNALTVFLIGVGLHVGILKPTGVTGTDGSIASRVTSGIGATGSVGRHAAW